MDWGVRREALSIHEPKSWKELRTFGGEWEAKLTGLPNSYDEWTEGWLPHLCFSFC